MQLTQALIDYSDRPAVLLPLLFLTTFFLEEAAILAAAALAASGTFEIYVLLPLVMTSVITSDWILYFIGAWAGQNRRIRRWIGEKTIQRGNVLLARGRVSAALTARLVPWLLLPVLVAFGFFGVTFRQFAPVNALFAAIYVNLVFWGAYNFNLLLFRSFAGAGWYWVVGIATLLVLGNILVVRHFSPPSDES